MTIKQDGGIPRRRFIELGDAATSVAMLAPSQLLAQEDGLVQTARRTASAVTITVQKLRGNVSVLMGAGGNIIDEIAAMKLTASTDAECGNGFRTPKQFIEAIFLGV